jgi:hypothetical protein
MTDPRRTTMLPLPTDRISIADLAVSPLCIGMVEDPDTIAAAFDAGINFFLLSADMHWPRYEATRISLARLLARIPRDQVVVAAASYVTQPEFCREPFREIIEAVPGLTVVDVLVAGGAYATELEERLPIYVDHRRDRFAGARAIGVSFHDRRAAATAINTGALDVAFVRYNAAHPGAQRDVFPLLGTPRRTRVLGFTSTGGHRPVPNADPDLWIPEITDHYRFALSRVGLDGLLCSPTQPRHVHELVAAMQRGPLSLEEEEHMMALAAMTT